MVKTTASLDRSRSAHKNNLDMLRLLLAFLVVLAHANNLFFETRGDSYRAPFFLLNMSDLAVSAFFLISGMLTYVSYQRDPDVIRFYLRRFFRVFPAYWTVVLVQTVLFLVIFSPLVIDGEVWHYLLVNLLTANFLDPSFVEGIRAFNGSLWTIKIEASYYAILPFIFFILRGRVLLVAAIVLSLLWAFALPDAELAKQLPGKLYLFAIGVVIARIPRAMAGDFTVPALILLPFAIWLTFLTKHMPVYFELSVALASICFVLVFLHRWVHHEPLDISYTLYLVHYPILVILNHTLLVDFSLPMTILISVPVIIVSALAVTFGVERRGLDWGRKLVKRQRNRETTRAKQEAA